ncbi:MAG: galactose-1-phosphate uridylyltransferase [Candidatus Aminicenantes bacterium]|nr:galactose-1-phosphate uridylyltransferase [Candidatus Aminicenantes bacterium]
MPELRKDIVTGRWVIISTERSKRPDDFRPTEMAEIKKESLTFCPFCPGNEVKTPPEVFSVRESHSAPDQPGWKIRVVPNKFPALQPGPPPPKKSRGVYQWMEGVGVHEVIIETPDHNQEMAELPVDHLAEIIRVYRSRTIAIEEQYHHQYVQIFKNKGKEAGASLSHPHSQIIATPIVPKRIKEEIYGAERLYRNHFRECAFCRMLKEELTSSERLIYQNERFVVLAPFASRFPFEMAILPLEHSAFFREITDEDSLHLAKALKQALSRLKSQLIDPAFNLVLHHAPNPQVSDKAWPGIYSYYHWHLELLPILTKVAGFELGTGFYINPVPPEVAADYLRKDEQVKS